MLSRIWIDERLRWYCSARRRRPIIFGLVSGSVPRVVVGDAEIGLQVVGVDRLSIGLAPSTESLTRVST